MKIIYTITGLLMGGAETITVNLARHMQERGHSVQILYLSGEQIIEVPKSIIIHNLHLKKTPLGFIKSLNRAKKIVREFQPDVVHANMFHAILFTRILRLFVKIPRLICTEHSNNYHGKLRLILEHCTDGLSDLNTNVSQMATDYFVKSGVFSAKKSMVVYNGIDMSRFCKNRNQNLRKELNINDDDFVFTNVSRFNEAKDHKTLVNAFSLVHQKNPKTKLLLVGDGELRSEIQKQIENSGISDFVILAGIHTNTQDYYNASDCFVLSSVYEGFGLVLVEAMACELPVVSTDCGGTKEIIVEKNDLVPIKEPDLLAAKMFEVMSYSTEQIENVGKRNRNAVEKFDLERITDKWELLYKGNIA